MVYLYNDTEWRYTILVGNPQYMSLPQPKHTPQWRTFTFSMSPHTLMSEQLKPFSLVSSSVNQPMALEAGCYNFLPHETLYLFEALKVK